MSPNVIPAKQPVKISQVHPPPVIAGLDPAIQSQGLNSVFFHRNFLKSIE